MYRIEKLVIVCLLFLANSSNVFAQQLPGYFGDSMVLQREKPLRIWGWAQPGQRITVRFAGKQLQAQTNVKGVWEVMLPPQQAGGPYELRITGKKTLSLKGILVGDVWFCSGQSNMEMRMNECDITQEQLEALAQANIRVLTMPHRMAGTPQDNIPALPWRTASLHNIPGFSAVAMYFAHYLHAHTKVPVGIMVSSWGGTDIEPWMSPQALSALEKHKPKLEKLQQIGEPDAYDARWQQLQKQWNDTLENFDAGLLQKWYEPGANYNGWDTINAPGVWDRLGYKGEGVGWFVRKVHLSADAAQKPALISLGPVHNRGIVYVNGTKLDPPRRIGERNIFLVPAALLREGENVLAVRVYKFWTFGGFIGKPADMFLSTATGNLSLAGTWYFKPGYFSRNPVLTGGPNAFIASLYQAMVHPFRLMPVKGFIWYQGENNVSRSGDYGWHLQQLIADWRRTWADTTLPFLIVQLPNFKNNDSHEANFARLRAQQQTATVVPGAHLAVTIDVGDSTDIHPKNKLPVGYRLHLLARKYAYGEVALVADGPTPQIARRNGNTVQITFMHTGAGLQANNAHGYLYGFELAGTDDVFHPAFAYISNNTVVLYSNKVAQPVKVRYAWADNPPVSLFNAEGLPAGPFVMNVSPE